jgi:hypothetical protein
LTDRGAAIAWAGNRRANKRLWARFTVQNCREETDILEIAWFDGPIGGSARKAICEKVSRQKVYKQTIFS